MKPVIDVIQLSKEELTFIDEAATINLFGGGTATADIVGKVAGGTMPVINRTGDNVWHLYALTTTGEMYKPVDPATGEYFGSTNPLNWDQRLTYNYG